MKRKQVDRSWFESAEGAAVVQLKTRATLERAVNERSERARIRIAEEKRRAELAASRPAFLGKMHPIKHWVESLGVSADSIREWCKSDLIHAQWIRGEWRISDGAMQDFLERENKRRVRQG